MLVQLIVFFSIIGASLAHAADPSFFVVDGDKLQPVKKVEAMKILITTNNTKEVVKCQPVKVDEDKGTLRNR
jgi:hypothetical protein